MCDALCLIKCVQTIKMEKNMKFKRFDLDDVDFCYHMNEILSDLEM